MCQSSASAGSNFLNYHFCLLLLCCKTYLYCFLPQFPPLGPWDVYHFLLLAQKFNKFSAEWSNLQLKGGILVWNSWYEVMYLFVRQTPTSSIRLKDEGWRTEGEGWRVKGEGLRWWWRWRMDGCLNNCHSPTQPQLELEPDLIMGRKPPLHPTLHPTRNF
jgi:hypothetical protein